jgi:hypothetical protein
MTFRGEPVLVIIALKYYVADLVLSPCLQSCHVAVWLDYWRRMQPGRDHGCPMGVILTR